MNDRNASPSDRIARGGAGNPELTSAPALATEKSSLLDADSETARWTHMYMCAALETLRQIDGLASAGSYRPAEALALSFVSQANQVYRGASKVLGKTSEVVERFDAKFPELRDLRNAIEHFDDYIHGKGKMQKRHVMPSVGMKIQGISGSPGSFMLKVAVHTTGFLPTSFTPDLHELATELRTLAQSAMTAGGLATPDHDTLCEYCAPQWSTDRTPVQRRQLTSGLPNAGTELARLVIGDESFEWRIDPLGAITGQDGERIAGCIEEIALALASLGWLYGKPSDATFPGVCWQLMPPNAPTALARLLRLGVVNRSLPAATNEHQATTAMRLINFGLEDPEIHEILRHTDEPQ